MIVLEHVDLLWAFINSRIGIPFSSDFRAIGAVTGGLLRAVIAYNGFTGRSCFMHSAIDDPSVIDRTFLRTIFHFPFVKCNLTHTLAMVDSANSRALDIDRRCGFKEVYRLRGAGLEGEDMVLLELKREECRWIKGLYHGRQVRSPSGSRLRGSGECTSEVIARGDAAADLGESAHDLNPVGDVLVDA